MSRFTLNIETDNAAFEGDGRNEEIARLLDDAARKLRMLDDAGVIRDINGNKVGHWKFED